MAGAANRRNVFRIAKDVTIRWSEDCIIHIERLRLNCKFTLPIS